MEKKSILDNFKNKVGVSFIEAHPYFEEALDGLLLVSRNQLKKYYKKADLEKRIDPHHTSYLPLNLMNHLKINPEYSGDQPELLFEDHNIIALSKPYKIHSHPLSYDEKDNILSFIRSKFNDDILHVNESHYDRGLLYRLDYETSGLIIYIKKQEILEQLRGGFHKAIKTKCYHAIVEGKFDQEGTHKHWFTPKGHKGEKQFVTNEIGEFFGELKAKCLKYNESKNQSLVEIDLITGLRHQIRASLAFLGFPIVGDPLYEGKENERLLLHCHRYVIEGEKLKYDLSADKKFSISQFL